MSIFWHQHKRYLNTPKMQSFQLGRLASMVLYICCVLIPTFANSHPGHIIHNTLEDSHVNSATNTRDIEYSNEKFQVLRTHNNQAKADLKHHLGNTVYWDDISRWEHAEGDVTSTTINHSDWDAVQIAAGATVIYRIPRRVFTRIFSEYDSFPNTLSFSYGDGSGLFLNKKEVQSLENNLLFMPQNQFWQLMIHNSGDSAETVSVLTSRPTGEKAFPQALTLLTPQSDSDFPFEKMREYELGPSTKTNSNSNISIETPHLGQRDNFIVNQHKTLYTIEGPAFIEVESLLLHVDPNEVLPSYSISAELDGKPWQFWQHQAAVFPFLRRASSGATGTEKLTRSTYIEKYYLQIPDGEHTLSLSTLRLVALRAFENSAWALTSNKDFLYPLLEQHQQKRVDYQLGLNNLTAALLTRSDKAKNKIINHWSDSHHPIELTKERAIKRSQFYRSLVASTSKPPLRTVNSPPAVSRYSSLQGHPALLDSEPSNNKTTFAELSEKASLTFSIPRRNGRSTLRIRIAGLDKQRQTFLLTDQLGNKSTLFYYPEFKSKLLSTNQPHLQDGFSSVAELFIPLIQATKSITVKALSPINNNSLFQLAYLTERNPTLANEELQQGLAKLHQNTPRAIIQYLQGELSAEASESRQQLDLLLSKLALRISVRAQQLEQDIPNMNNQLTAGINVPKNWQLQIEKRLNKNDFAGAIDITAPLTRHYDQQIRTQAAQLQTQLLWDAEAFFLYEQWLLNLVTSKEHVRLNSFAEKALFEFYHQQDKMGSIEKLAAYRFMQSGELQYLQQLESSLNHQSSLLLKQQLTTIYNVLNPNSIAENKPNEAIKSEKGTRNKPLWQSINADVVSARSARLLLGHALNNYSSRHIANPDQGLELTIEGPAILAIGHRSLLPTGIEQSQDDWLIVQDQLKNYLEEGHSLNTKNSTQQTLYFPTFKTARSNDVSLVGSYTRVSGEQSIKYAISAGTHTIKIQPKYSGAVISLSKLALNPAATETNTSTVKKAQSIGLTLVDISKTIERSLVAHKHQNLSTEKTLLRLIWQIEHNKLFTVNKSQNESTLLSLIAQGNQLAQDIKKTSSSNRLIQRLNQYTQWQLEQQLVDSAGRRIVEFTTTPISNTKAQIRQALKGHQIESALKLSPLNDLNFSLDINKSSELKLQLKQLAPLNAFSKPAIIEVWINEQPFRKIWLKPNNAFNNIKLPLIAGTHQVRIALFNPKSDQHVLFKAQLKTQKVWADIDIPVKQTYYVSSRKHPIKVFAAAQQWLRIDDYKNDKVYRSYLFQSQHGVISFPPESGQSERLVRIYKQRLKPDLNDLPASSALRNLPIEAQYEYSPSKHKWRLSDALEFGEQNEGTWGGYLRFANQASLEDEEPNINTSRNSLQIGHLYQKRLFEDDFWRTTSGDWSNNAYWRSDTFIRQTSFSGDTLGTEQRLHIADPLTNWQFSMKAKAQLFQATNNFSDDILSFYTDAQYRHDWRVNRQQRFNASVTGFARYFDDKSPAGSRDIDPLVYSPYKRDHRYGLRLAGNWRYKLMQDSHFNLGSQLISNESILSMDQLSLQVGYQQYFKALTAGITIKNIQRFSDDDRIKGSQQNEIKGSLRYHHWNVTGNEWYLGLNAKYNLSHNESTLALTFGFNHSDGRGTRDYLPTVLPMRDLYEQQGIQQQEMNTLTNEGSL